MITIGFMVDISGLQANLELTYLAKESEKVPNHASS